MESEGFLDLDDVDSAAHNPPLGPQFRRIVVGYECDEQARKAMEIAAILASDLGSELIVAATIPPPVATPLDSLNPDLYGQVLRDLKRQLREELHDRGYDKNGEQEIHVSVAKPVEHILRIAQDNQADLIIVGSHGRHGFGQVVLGSVSESLATRSTCPVMVVGPECEVPDARLQTVLFATDLDDTGISAGLFAAALARKSNSKLVALHSVRRKPPAAGREREWQEDFLREQLRLSVQEDGQHNTVPVEFQVTYGEASEEILAASGSCHAGLIVLGGGHHGFIADHSPWRTLTPILQFARCPVVIVSDQCT